MSGRILLALAVAVLLVAAWYEFDIGAKLDLIERCRDSGACG